MKSVKCVMYTVAKGLNLSLPFSVGNILRSLIRHVLCLQMFRLGEILPEKRRKRRVRESGVCLGRFDRGVSERNRSEGNPRGGNLFVGSQVPEDLGTTRRSGNEREFVWEISGRRQDNERQDFVR